MLEACLVAQATVYYDYLNTGHIPPRVGADIMAKRGSGGTFETDDGYLVVSALSQEAFEHLCRTIDRADLLDDPRFKVNAGGLKHAAELREILAEAFRHGSAEDWERKLVAGGVPAGRLNEVPQVAAHPQIAARGAFTTFTNVPGIGRDVRVLNAGFQLDGRQLRPDRPPPVLGADTQEVLQAMGYTPEDIAELAACGAIRCASDKTALKQFNSED